MGIVWRIVECGGGDVGMVDSWASRDGIPLVPVYVVSPCISISIYICLYLSVSSGGVSIEMQGRANRV